MSTYSEQAQPIGASMAAKQQQKAAKEAAISELAAAIAWGEPYTTDEEARASAETTWDQNFYRYGFWPAVGQCEVAAARYRDM